MRKINTTISVVLTAICILISINVKAQETFTPSHLKAAENLLIAMKEPERYTKTIDNMLAMQRKLVQRQASPSEKQQAFAEAMKSFFAKYMNWDQLKNDEAEMYAAAFSEAELKELTKFYQSSLGQKVVSTLPELQQKGMMLGQKIVMAHQAELQEMIKAASGN